MDAIVRKAQALSAAAMNTTYALLCASLRTWGALRDRIHARLIRMQCVRGFERVECERCCVVVVVFSFSLTSLPSPCAILNSLQQEDNIALSLYVNNLCSALRTAAREHNVEEAGLSRPWLCEFGVALDSLARSFANVSPGGLPHGLVGVAQYREELARIEKRLSNCIANVHFSSAVGR